MSGRTTYPRISCPPLELAVPLPHLYSVKIISMCMPRHKRGVVYIYGKVSEKRDLACIIKKHNKNAPRLKCYNVRTVNATVFLFSALHTTPFLYDKIHFGILNMLHASVAMSDTPWGSNSPYLSAGNLYSFQN